MSEKRHRPEQNNNTDGCYDNNKDALNAADCGLPAGSVYVKRWHCAHPPATYKDIIIMLAPYELSYQVGSSWSRPQAPVYADASDAWVRQWWTKTFLP